MFINVQSSFSYDIPDRIEWSASTTAIPETETQVFNYKNFLYVNPELLTLIKKKLGEFDTGKNFTVSIR